MTAPLAIVRTRDAESGGPAAVRPVPPREPAVVRHARALDLLRGRQVLILNCHDVRHPAAGGAETYVHEIARRWVAAGIGVTLLTTGRAGTPDTETIDGIVIRRAGRELSVHPRTVGRRWRWGDRFDAVLDCRNGVPFFAPVTLGPRVPVVQLVLEDQFESRLPAAVGRLLEGPMARKLYGRGRSVAVSPSTREQMRGRLGVDGVIDIVPHGSRPVGPLRRSRASDPTIVLVSRLVPDKRITLLVDAVAAIRHRVPGLTVDVLGSGPALAGLRAAAAERGLAGSLLFHGELDDAARDAMTARAWLTTSTSSGADWAGAVLDAAAVGVPCVALRAPGVQDAVLDGRTGWLVDTPESFAGALLRALADLADPLRSTVMSEECLAWADCFTWERSAELLAGTLVAEMQRLRHTTLGRRDGTRVRARADSATAAWFAHPDPAVLAARLRVTDEICSAGTAAAAVLRGGDDLAAVALLDGLGAVDIRVRPAARHEVLAGPALLDRRFRRRLLLPSADPAEPARPLLAPSLIHRGDA